jgi:hypothetical protein
MRYPNGMLACVRSQVINRIERNVTSADVLRLIIQSWARRGLNCKGALLVISFKSEDA